MTESKIKYSQILLHILIAAFSSATLIAAEPSRLSKKLHTYEVQEEQNEIDPLYQFISTRGDDNALKLGLFVAQPSETNSVSHRAADDMAILESGRRYNYDRRPHSPYRPYFSLAPIRSPQTRHNKYSHIETAGSDQYLTPEFVKFKNEIDIETDRTHVKGMKMSKDTAYSPTIVYENASFKKFPHGGGFYPSEQTMADEPSSDYVDSPSSDPYSSSDSYNSNSPSSSYPSSYSSSYTGSATPPSSSSSSPYNFDSSEISYPPFPSLHSSENSDSPPPPSPYSDSDDRSQDYSSGGGNSFNDFPSYSYDDTTPNHPSSAHHESKFPYSYHHYGGEEDGGESDYPIPPTDSKWFPKPKSFSDGKYKSPFSGIKQSQRTYSPFRGRKKGATGDDEYAFPRRGPQTQAGGGGGGAADDEDEDFDTNDGASSDPFVNDDNENENAEDEDEEEEDESPSPPPRKGKLTQSSTRRERIRPAASRKRHCVKKQQKMFDDDDFTSDVACFVCKDSSTGNTYETCD